MASGEPIKSRAALMYAEGEPLVIEETLVPAPGPGQVRVKMVSVGICASDAHYVWGKMKASEYGHNLPMILGHEGAGVVESVGEGVTDLKPGDHVLTTFVPTCGQCYGCQMSNICFVHTFQTLGGRQIQTLAKDGSPVYGFCSIGAYSEYTTVGQEIVRKIDPEANLEHSAVISCAVVTGFYSAVHLAKVKPGSTCVVWGIGAIGLNAIQGCRFNGAKNIIAVDINPDKRDIALKFGATDFINPKDRPLEDYIRETVPIGIDYAFDCFGSQVIVDQALKLLSPFGTFTMVGFPSAETKIVYPARELFLGRKIISGIMGGQSNACYPELVQLYKDKRILVDELITNKFPLNEINQAFDVLKQGRCARSLIIFGV